MWLLWNLVFVLVHSKYIFVHKTNVVINNFYPSSSACYIGEQSQDLLPPPSTSTSQPSTPFSAHCPQTEQHTYISYPMSPPELNLPETEATHPQGLPRSSGTTTAQPNLAEVKGVSYEALQLDEKFLNVLTRTKMEFSR